jgi:hypothetical protein
MTCVSRTDNGKEQHNFRTNHSRMDKRRSNPTVQQNRWPGAMTSLHHVYEVQPRQDHRDVDLISDALPFGPPVV